MAFFSGIDIAVDNWLYKNEETIKKIFTDNMVNIALRGTYFLAPYLVFKQKQGYLPYFFTSLGIMAVGKWAFGREYQEDIPTGKDIWNPFSVPLKECYKKAFPSGHTTATISTALYCNDLLSWAWCCFVILVIFFRREHWLFDIIFGIFLGLLVFLVSKVIGPFNIFNINSVAGGIKTFSDITNIITGLKNSWDLFNSISYFIY